MVQMSLFLQDIHGIDIFFHLKYILVLQITSSLIITGSLKGLKLLQNAKKWQKKSGKSAKSELTISRKNALVAKLNKTESSPLTLFSQMTPSWWKVTKKYMSEKKLC